MKRFSVNNMVLQVLGLVLLTAAVLKGHELLTIPAANEDLWSWRPFLIFQVEFELALGIWLLSGVFKRVAWLAALICFSLFCGVTLYRGLIGAASCGCFGRVHINPWIALTAIDLPAVIALSLLRPVGLFAPLLSFLRRQESIRDIIRIRPKPVGAPLRSFVTAGFILLVLSATAPILAFNKPASATSTYEVLEPKTWIGNELPIMRYIDIAEQLKAGIWLILFYHHDCPDCRKAIPQYEQMARDLYGNEDFLRIALIEVPPYGPSRIVPHGACTLGRLADVKEWFITTPATVLTCALKVRAAWEAQNLDLDTILTEAARSDGRSRETCKPKSTSTLSQRLSRREGSYMRGV